MYINKTILYCKSSEEIFKTFTFSRQSFTRKILRNILLQRFANQLLQMRDIIF